VSDWQCLEERDGSDDLVARYTYAPGYIDAVAVQERDLNADGDFLDDDEVVYYHSSTLFSIYALSDADENVIERYRYDAYGACTVLDADFSDDADNASDVDNPYTFTARRLDTELDLMQYRYRYYSSTLGRFIRRDPIEYHDGYSLYAYVACRSTIAHDPLGLKSQYARCRLDDEWPPAWTREPSGRIVGCSQRYYCWLEDKDWLEWRHGDDPLYPGVCYFDRSDYCDDECYDPTDERCFECNCQAEYERRMEGAPPEGHIGGPLCWGLCEIGCHLLCDLATGGNFVVCLVACFFTCEALCAEPVE